MSIHSGVPVSSLINLHVCPRDSHEYLEQVFPSLPHFAQSAPPRGGCHGLHSNVTLTFLTSPIPNALNITITIITTTTIIIPIVNNVPAAAPTCARLRLPSIPAPVAVPAAHTSATPIMPATVPAIPN